MNKKHATIQNSLIVLIAMCSTLSASVKERIINNFSFSIQNDSIEFENSELISENGAPSLPLITQTYLLPAGTDMNSVDVSVKSSPVVTAKGSVATTQLFTTDNDGNFVSVDSETEYPTCYPVSPLYNYSVGKLNQFNLVTVTLSPYQYESAKGELIQSDTMDLTISYSLKSGSRSLGTVRNSDVSTINSLAVNADEFLDSYGTVSASRSTSGHYLILTSSKILPQLSALESFISSKEAQGFTVSVCTEDSWSGPATGGDVHQVRNWLKENYESEGYTHLLILDNPVDGAVPMLVVSPDFSGRYEPLIDMYYGELSGNWDLNGDGKYAEYGFFSSKDFEAGGVDTYMELAVGRIPFYGDASVVNTILNRIVNYSAESSADAAWRKHIYMPMNDFDLGHRDGSQYGNVIKTNVIDKSDWEMTTLYGSDCSIDKVTSLWNEANAGLVVWQAHGLQDYAENLMFSSDAAGLTAPTHTYQTSCHTGKPEYSENLAFSILKSSAISTIGAAVQCLYTSNKTTYGEKGGARDYGYIYAKHMILNKKPAGESLAEARAELAIKSSSDWLNCVETNLYGCPAVGPYTTDITAGAVSNTVHERSTRRFEMVRTPAGITLKSSAAVIQGGRVSLFSLSGRKVSDVALKPGKSEYSISGNAFAPGIYIAQIELKTEAGVERHSLRLNQIR